MGSSEQWLVSRTEIHTRHRSIIVKSTPNSAADCHSFLVDNTADQPRQRRQRQGWIEMSGPSSEAWVRAMIGPLVRDIDPEYFRSKRWFGSKGRKIKGIELVDFCL